MFHLLPPGTALGVVGVAGGVGATLASMSGSLTSGLVAQVGRAGTRMPPSAADQHTPTLALIFVATSRGSKNLGSSLSCS
jgi:hypothetical protein